jgi:predicted ribosomally synthesized peptide with nif11-like leader
MSKEQLSALLAKLKDDAELQEKLKGAADLDAAIALAKEAGSPGFRKDVTPLISTPGGLRS